MLLILSVVTTTAIGARFMHNFLAGLPVIADDSDLWPWPWLLQHPSRFLLGLPFSSSLLAILLSHEFGHYFACRIHKIRCTLPWVLPAPTLSGTVGAVIQIRGHIPNRRALLDVGVYGPIVGYCVSLIVIVLGFLLSSPATGPAVHAGDPETSLVHFGEPLTLGLIHHAVVLLQPATPAFVNANRHPVLIAGWIGLFITALNLLPGGQLDGGHILYAISPRLHRAATWLLPFALLAAGFFYWIGWIVWGLILLIPAMRHPRVPAERSLDRSRLMLSLVALVILILTFSAEPFQGNSVFHYLHAH
jgi:membrane-associated protease RseP (regulator of RpoE activity)